MSITQSYPMDSYLIHEQEEMAGRFVTGFEGVSEKFFSGWVLNDSIFEITITMPAPEPETLIILSIGIFILTSIRIYKKYDNQPKL